MSATYQNFVERLKEERLRLVLSQAELGRRLRMGQSHYSKVELGTRRFTYYETQCLCETDVDIYYIFTGNKYDIEVDDFFLKCTFEELVCYLEILCDILIYLNDKKVLRLLKNMQKKIENIQYAVMLCEKGKTIFYKLRRALDYNQMKMADILEVDVKKLRGMESGKILPDSEIIWHLSEKFYIPYSLFLNDRKGLACEISFLLRVIDEYKRNDFLNSIKAMHNIFTKEAWEYTY